MQRYDKYLNYPNIFAYICIYAIFFLFSGQSGDEKWSNTHNFAAFSTNVIYIKVLLKDNRATYEDLAKIIGVDRTTIRRNIAVLKEIGAIRRVGEDKNGYWEVLIAIDNVV